LMGRMVDLGSFGGSGDWGRVPVWAGLIGCVEDLAAGCGAAGAASDAAVPEEDVEDVAGVGDVCDVGDEGGCVRGLGWDGADAGEEAGGKIGTGLVV